MLLHIAEVLDAEALRRIRDRLKGAPWIDGRATAGHQSARVKDNAQTPEDHPATVAVGAIILDALKANSVFVSAALPAQISPPLINRYAGGQAYGPHIDGALRPLGGASMRTDLSATLFLSDPDDYDGGVLTLRNASGLHEVKLAAGDMVLYAGTSVHHVTPVTRGARVAAFFWVQSVVRDEVRRSMLFDLDTSLQALMRDIPDHPEMAGLMGHYHNLLRQWAEV